MSENVVASLEFLEEHRAELEVRRRACRGNGGTCTGCGSSIHRGDQVVVLGKTIATILDGHPRRGLEIKLGHTFQKFALMCLECGERWLAGPGPGELAGL